MIPNPYAWIVGLVVVIGLVTGAGVAGFRSGSALTQARWDSSVLAKKAGEEAALKAAAAAIAKIEVKSEKHVQPIRTEIRTNTVYVECKHSPESLKHLNSLITGFDSVGEVPGISSGTDLVPPQPASQPETAFAK